MNALVHPKSTDEAKKAASEAKNLLGFFKGMAKEMNDMHKEAARIIEETKTPQEQFVDRLREIKKLQEAGGCSPRNKPNAPERPPTRNWETGPKRPWQRRRGSEWRTLRRRFKRALPTKAAEKAQKALAQKQADALQQLVDGPVKVTILNPTEPGAIWS